MSHRLPYNGNATTGPVGSGGDRGCTGDLQDGSVHAPPPGDVRRGRISRGDRVTVLVDNRGHHLNHEDGHLAGRGGEREECREDGGDEAGNGPATGGGGGVMGDPFLVV